jgi:predicted PhzF superfamily epimerase YddE/YHI9
MDGAPLFFVDAFAFDGARGTGNPAAVCFALSAAAIDGLTEWQQQLAFELGKAETVFVAPLGEASTNADGEATQEASGSRVFRFRIRWFTPEQEVPLCGHATLAASHCLSTQPWPASWRAASTTPFRQGTDGFSFTGSDGRIFDVATTPGAPRYTLRFPNNMSERVAAVSDTTVGHAALLPCLERALTTVAVPPGSNATALTRRAFDAATDLKELWYNAPTGKYIAVLHSALQLVELRADHGALRSYVGAVLPATKSVTFVVFLGEDVAGCELVHQLASDRVAAARVCDATRFDVASRHMATWVGIDEDPVTGSAHTVHSPMAAARLGRSNLRCAQYYPRRGGIVDVRVAPDAVFLSGTGVITFAANVVNLGEK